VITLCDNRPLIGMSVPSALAPIQDISESSQLGLGNSQPEANHHPNDPKPRSGHSNNPNNPNNPTTPNITSQHQNPSTDRVNMSGGQTDPAVNNPIVSPPPVLNDPSLTSSSSQPSQQPGTDVMPVAPMSPQPPSSHGSVGFGLGSVTNNPTLPNPPVRPPPLSLAGSVFNSAAPSPVTHPYTGPGTPLAHTQVKGTHSHLSHHNNNNNPLSVTPGTTKSAWGRLRNKSTTPSARAPARRERDDREEKREYAGVRQSGHRVGGEAVVKPGVVRKHRAVTAEKSQLLFLPRSAMIKV